MAQLPANHYLDVRSADDVCIVGTRVGLEHLLDGYLAGATAEQLAIEYPSVTLEQIHGIIAYYLRYQPLVDEYLRSFHASSLARQQEKRVAADVVQRLRQLASERVLR